MIPSILEALPSFLVQDTDEHDYDKYFGYCRKDGKWYLVKISILYGSDDNPIGESYRYACLSNNPLVINYSGAWDARTSLNYDYAYLLQI